MGAEGLDGIGAGEELGNNVVGADMRAVCGYDYGVVALVFSVVVAFDVCAVVHFVSILSWYVERR